MIILHMHMSTYSIMYDLIINHRLQIKMNSRKIAQICPIVMIMIKFKILIKNAMVCGNENKRINQFLEGCSKSQSMHCTSNITTRMGLLGHIRYN